MNTDGHRIKPMHRLTLEDAANGYNTFLNKEDHCVKVILKPNGFNGHSHIPQDEREPEPADMV